MVTFLNIGLLVVLIAAFIIGAKRGLINSAIRFGMAYIIFILTSLFSGAVEGIVSPIIQGVDGYETMELAGTLFGFNVNQATNMFAFSITYIGLYFVVNVILYKLVIARMIKKITKSIPIVGTADQFLGGILQIGMVIIAIYVGLMMGAVMGSDVAVAIDNSIVAQVILSICNIYLIPIVRMFVINFS